MKVFISLAYKGFSEEEILNRRELLTRLTKQSVLESTEIEIIQNYQPDFNKNSIARIGVSLVGMSNADVVLIHSKHRRKLRDLDMDCYLESLGNSEIEFLVARAYEAKLGITIKEYYFELDTEGRAKSAHWVNEDIMNYESWADFENDESAIGNIVGYDDLLDE